MSPDLERRAGGRTTWRVTACFVQLLIAAAILMAAASPAPALDTASTQDPWGHDLQVIANLKERPPHRKVAFFLGGSAALEAMVSDESWSAQVQSLGANVLAYDLSSSNRTFAESLALVAALPRDAVRGVAFIGVSPACFDRAKTRANITLPPPAFPLPEWRQHLWVRERMESDEAKRADVDYWNEKCLPHFRLYFRSQSRILGDLIEVCKAHHLRPVLIETPLNMAIIGHAFDTPIARVRSLCRELSVTHSIRFRQHAVRDARLLNTDFGDLYHMLDTGRVKWQRLMSGATARQLL
jgi:hypothetical protein